MIEWRRIRQVCLAPRRFVTGELFGHRNQFFNFQVSVRTQGLQRLPELRAADEQCVIDGNQSASVNNERADFVDQSSVIVFRVHHSFAGRSEKRRIKQDAIKQLFGSNHPADQRLEISGLKTRFVNRKSVQRARSLGHVQEVAIQIKLDNAQSSGGLSGDAQTADVCEGVQHSLAAQVLLYPVSQIARIQIQTGVAVHLQRDGIPHTVFADFDAQLFASQQHAVASLWRFRVARFNNTALSFSDWGKRDCKTLARRRWWIVAGLAFQSRE